MDNIRVILAVVSAVIGALLLITFFVRSRRTPGSSGWVLGTLFLVAAVVLWLRGSGPGEIVVPDGEETITQLEPETPVDEIVPDGGSSGGVKSSAKSPGSSSGQRSAEDGIADEETMRDGGSASTPARLPQGTKSRTTPGASRPRSSASQKLPIEDRIFAAVLASFVWIEEFFDEYASSAPTESPSEVRPADVAEAPDIEFPDIRFESSSANLTSESQIDLKILATRLLTEYPKGVLEIQAYVDSVGPEAFNYVLTQARADAVRDLLVAEGIKEHRLIARGYGTGNEKPDLAAARIEFVVRH